MESIHVGGPYFDNLSVGQVFDTAPAVTLTSGIAATHQAILGTRLRLPLDHHLSQAVTGCLGAVASPSLVCDIAIGQSTLATHRVKANLFYRGLRFFRFPLIGDTLHTRTAVVGLRENGPKDGRKPTGLAALRITSTDQDGNLVLDFYRCAMLPLRDSPAPDRSIHADDLSQIGPSENAAPILPDWDLATYRAKVPGPYFSPSLAGTVFTSTGDVVTNAPELARLTLNIAATHHDERVGANGRLVYGGHTIGIALAQATRALPNMVTVLNWTSCDHVAPVHEGGTLTSELHVESATPAENGGGILQLRSLVYLHTPSAPATQVLDWRFSALMA
ncbi:MaoC family dehydratase [Hoyosella altamirensis]|uniref:Acyl dehydratase n=1 Tax=Hoyosella altamirensis TaxID=616997 RepID=A0A839RP10_9ACTN|nr:MaoC family dehydratase [Hoyosella altamirensis]MBB3038250.1 acyl dehydratase [Hoyosella altamirensis]